MYMYVLHCIAQAYSYIHIYTYTHIFVKDIFDMQGGLPRAKLQEIVLFIIPRLPLLQRPARDPVDDRYRVRAVAKGCILV